MTQHTDQRYICMVSGGSDSVALLVSLCTQGIFDEDSEDYLPVKRDNIYVLHVNHMLRGKDADDDEEFVRKLCAKLEVHFEVKRLKVLELMKEAGASNFEAYARQLRYQAADELHARLQYERKLEAEQISILTAHTADDRAETALMHLIEGSSLAGLTSLKKKRGYIYRPFLHKTRKELQVFLQERGYTWREDATNADTRYFRSFVRHKIVRLAQEKNPEFLASISRSLDTFQLEHDYLSTQADQAFRELVVEAHRGMLVLKQTEFSQLHEAIQRRVALRALQELDSYSRFETQHIMAVVQALHRVGFSRNVAGALEIRHDHGCIVLRNTHHAPPCLEELELPVPACIELPALGRTVCTRLIEVPSGSDPVAFAQSLSVSEVTSFMNRTLVFDAERAGCRAELLNRGEACLRLRPARPGDSFEPFGMRGTKKVSELLSEQKIPRYLRQLVPLIETKDSGELVCIAGIRLNRNFACRKNSVRLVELSFEQS